MDGRDGTMDAVRAQARGEVRRYTHELFARDDNGARVLSLAACGVHVEYSNSSGDFHMHKYTVPAFSDEELWAHYIIAVEHLALRGIEVLATANSATDRHALCRVLPHAPRIRTVLLRETCLFVVAGAARLVMELQDVGRCNHSNAFVPHCVLRRMHILTERLRQEAQTATQAEQPQLSFFITDTTKRHALPCICTLNTPPCAQNNLIAFNGCARCWTLVYTGARDTLFWRVVGPNGGLIFYDREDDGADHHSLTEVPSQNVAGQVRASIASSSELLLSRPGVEAHVIATQCCCVRCLVLKKGSWLFGSVLRHELFVTSPRLVVGRNAFTCLLARLRHLDEQFQPPLSPFASALFAGTEGRLALFAQLSDEETARALFLDTAFLALLCELSAEASTIAAAALVDDAQVDMLWRSDPHSEMECVIEPGSGAWLHSLFAQDGLVAQVLTARGAKLHFLRFRLLSMMLGSA
jgi:hypothetical protein